MGDRSEKSARGRLSVGGLMKIAVQILGFGVCIALFVWVCVRAFGGADEESQAALQRLRDAQWWELGALLGLSLVSLFLNGVIFERSLAPVRKIPLADALSVNAIATLLANLPLKLSVLFRVLVHTRRNGVPILVMGSWLGVVAVPFLAVGGSLTVLALLRDTLGDAAWVVCSLVAAGVCAGVIVLVARVFSGEFGDRMIGWVTTRFTRSEHRRVVLRARLIELHEGVRMLADARMVGVCTALRTLDFVLQGARFWVAAWIVGLALSPADSMLCGVTYITTDAVAPTGSMGAREGATIGVLDRVTGKDPSAIAVLVAVVGADLSMRLLTSLAGLVYLVATGMLRRRAVGDGMNGGGAGGDAGGDAVGGTDT